MKSVPQSQRQSKKCQCGGALEKASGEQLWAFIDQRGSITLTEGTYRELKSLGLTRQQVTRAVNMLEEQGRIKLGPPAAWGVEVEAIQ